MHMRRDAKTLLEQRLQMPRADLGPTRKLLKAERLVHSLLHQPHRLEQPLVEHTDAARRGPDLATSAAALENKMYLPSGENTVPIECPFAVALTWPIDAPAFASNSTPAPRAISAPVTIDNKKRRMRFMACL